MKRRCVVSWKTVSKFPLMVTLAVLDISSEELGDKHSFADL